MPKTARPIWHEIRHNTRSIEDAERALLQAEAA
jgi:hypothetical protein